MRVLFLYAITAVLVSAAPTQPRGEFLHGTILNSKIYPGTENDFQVYVPAEYDPMHPACLLVKLDGLGPYEAAVLDRVIAEKEAPVTIGVGITAGTIWKDPPGTPKRRGIRFNRSYEFDSTNGRFADFVLNEILPSVRKLKTHDGRPINISNAGNDHAVMGASTGGIGSFTLAWQRPDQFTRVYSEIGTFVSMRGGNEYPALIRKTDPKPIRIFLEDGSTDAWNPLFGSWYDANLNMNSALEFAGYDVAHAWGTHGHDSGPGQTMLPDVLRWLWRDYPAPVKSGTSSNSTLQEITIPGEGWERLPQTFRAAGGLAASSDGDVTVADASAKALYRLSMDGKSTVFAKSIPVSAESFGPDGSLYALVPEKREVVQVDARGKIRTIAKGIEGRGITVTHEGALYVSEPGHVWRIQRDGKRSRVDEGISSASGVSFSPDRSLFYVAEAGTRWVYSYVVQADGTLADKQRFYRLHITDIPNDSGAADLAVDTHGNLYVATRMGIQVCDQNGRVRAILPLPTPSGAARSVCFGGKHLEFLYVTDGMQVFRRRLKVPGFAPGGESIAVPSQGAA